MMNPTTRKLTFIFISGLFLKQTPVNCFHLGHSSKIHARLEINNPTSFFPRDGQSKQLVTALSAAPIFTSVVATGRDVISSQDLSSSTTFSERVFRDAAQVAFDLTGIVKQSGMTTVALTTIGRGCLLVTSLHQYRNQPEELLCSLVLFLDSLKEMAISIFRASAVKSPSKHTTIAFALRLLMSLINVERDFFDPLSESEVCEDVSEIASDLTDVFYGRSVFMYLGTFGRTIALASNFFPHHACHPEQVLCQSIMLTISLNRLMDKVQSE